MSHNRFAARPYVSGAVLQKAVPDALTVRFWQRRFFGDKEFRRQTRLCEMNVKRYFRKYTLVYRHVFCFFFFFKFNNGHTDLYSNSFTTVMPHKCIVANCVCFIAKPIYFNRIFFFERESVA